MISGHKSMQMFRNYTFLRAEDLVCRLDQLGLRLVQLSRINPA